MLFPDLLQVQSRKVQEANFRHQNDLVWNIPDVHHNR
jgi:hypothetical protein